MRPSGCTNFRRRKDPAQETANSLGATSYAGRPSKKGAKDAVNHPGVYFKRAPTRLHHALRLVT